MPRIHRNRRGKRAARQADQGEATTPPATAPEAVGEDKQENPEDIARVDNLAVMCLQDKDIQIVVSGRHNAGTGKAPDFKSYVVGKTPMGGYVRKKEASVDDYSIFRSTEPGVEEYTLFRKTETSAEEYTGKGDTETEPMDTETAAEN